MTALVFGSHFSSPLFAAPEMSPPMSPPMSPDSSSELNPTSPAESPRKKFKKSRRKKRRVKAPVKREAVQTPPASSSWDWSREFSVGYEGRYAIAEKKTVFHRAILDASGQLKQFSAAPLTLAVSGRLRGPSNREGGGNDARAEILEAYVERSLGQVSLGFGLHQVSWGETFGLYNITDVVNPVDFYEAQDLDPSEAKIPVIMAAATWSPTPFTLQLLAGPAPRRSKMPRDLNGILLDEPYSYTFIDDGEYGGRIGFLSSFGLDLKAFSYMHWNRRPAFGMRFIGFEPRIFLQERLLATSGVSFSQAFNSFVLHGDMAYTDRTPVTDLTPGGVQKKSSLVQGSLGSDYTSDDGQMTIGIQAQMDHWTKKNPALEKRYLSWGGIRGSASVLSETLNLECTILRGFNNHDTIVQPAVSIEPCCGLEFDLRGYFVFSRDDGDREFFQKKRDLYSQVSWKF